MGNKEELIALAKADLYMSKLALDSSNDELVQNLAAYHTEQAVEKWVKAQLKNADIEPGLSHDIDELISEMEKAKLSCPVFIKEKGYEITRWATSIRYNINRKVAHDTVRDINQKLTELFEDGQ